MAVGDSRGKLLSALDLFFGETVPMRPGHVRPEYNLMVAFSGGPDSTALLWGLDKISAERGFRLEAAHVDHRLDDASPRRAEAAARICEQLGLPLTLLVRPVPERLTRERGREAAAREIRYRALEEVRSARGATHVVTAHHLDDQIETVCMRLLQGSGWEGLAGIPERNGHLLRPLLELRRADLLEAVAPTGLEAVDDPSNSDLTLLRNRVRHELWPFLDGLHPELRRSCSRVARAARGARLTVERRLSATLDPAPVGAGAGASLDASALAKLPPALLPAAAALLHRTAGAPYPPSLAAVSELARQMARGNRIGGDAGDGWRWQASRGRLHLVRQSDAAADFTYTLEVPGAVEVAEVSLRMKVGRGPVEPWMFRGAATRAGLGAAVDAGHPVVVRNRRPGDRLQPLGCSYSRRLKEILIDRRIPRAERDRIPLLCVGDRIAWVPGVTVDEAFRLREGEDAWVAELQPA